MFFLLSVKKSKTSYFSSMRLYDTKFTYRPSNFEVSFQNCFFKIKHFKVMLQWLYKFDGGLNIYICCNFEIVANLIYTESDVNLLPVTLFSENSSLEGTC